MQVVVGTFSSDPLETQTHAHTQTQEDSNQSIHTMVVKTSNSPFYEPVQKQSSIHVQSRVSNEPQSYCFTHAMSSQSLDWRMNPNDTNTHFKRGCWLMISIHQHIPFLFKASNVLFHRWRLLSNKCYEITYNVDNIHRLSQTFKVICVHIRCVIAHQYQFHLLTCLDCFSFRLLFICFV